MLKQHEDIVCVDKATWRRMWQSRRGTNLSTSRSFTRILLAYHETRCCELCQEVWSVPKARSHSPHALWWPKSGHKPLTLCAMGNEHSGAPIHRCCVEIFFAYSHWLLQQMGRSRSICHHQRQIRFRVSLEKHHLPIWNPIGNYS